LHRIPERRYFERISGQTEFMVWPLEKLYRIRPNGNVLVELEEDELGLKGEPNTQELIAWLTTTRKPVAKDVARLSLDEEILETLP